MDWTTAVAGGSGAAFVVTPPGDGDGDVVVIEWEGMAFPTPSTTGSRQGLPALIRVQSPTLYPRYTRCWVRGRLSSAAAAAAVRVVVVPLPSAARPAAAAMPKVAASPSSDELELTYWLDDVPKPPPDG